MSLYFYHDADSFVHRLHPVTKILTVALLFVPTLAFAQAAPLGAVLAGVVGLALWAKGVVTLRRMWKLLALLFVFTVGVWTLVGQGGQRLNAAAAGYGLAMAFRLEAMVCIGLIFVTVTKVEDLAAGLHRLGVPFPVCFAMTLAFRLIPTFMATAGTVVEAQQCRGLDFESGGLWARLRKYVPLFVPVLISSVKRAELLALGLESKGFGCGARRTSATAYAVTWRDLAAGLVCAAAAAGAVVARAAM